MTQSIIEDGNREAMGTRLGWGCFGRAGENAGKCHKLAKKKWPNYCLIKDIERNNKNSTDGNC